MKAAPTNIGVSLPLLFSALLGSVVGLAALLIGMFLLFEVLAPIRLAILLLGIQTADAARFMTITSTPLGRIPTAAIWGLGAILVSCYCLPTSITKGRSLHLSRSSKVSILSAVALLTVFSLSAVAPALAISSTQTSEFNQFNNSPCNFYTFTDGTNYYGQNCNTGIIQFGGVGTTDVGALINSEVGVLTNGGLIDVAQGTYTLSTTLTMTQSIQIIGESFNIGAQIGTCTTCGVVFLGSQAAGTPMIKPTGFSETLQYLTLNGQKVSNSVVAGQDCIQIDTSASLLLIDRVSVVNCPDAGIYDNAPAGEDVISNVDVKTNNLAGYYCNSCYDEHLIGGDYGSNVGPGIKGVTCNDLTLVGIHEFLSTTDNGAVFSNCGNIMVSSSTFHTNWKNGLEIFKSVAGAFDGELSTVTGSTFYDNSIVGAGQFVGLQIAGSTGDIATDNTITGDVFWDDQGVHTQTYGVEESPFANGNTITGNVFGVEVTAAIFSTATASQIHSNIGINPKGKLGNFLIGGTSAVTVHTLGIFGGQNSTTEIASQTYTIVGDDVFVTSANSANANNAILIKDNLGNTVLGPVSTLTAQYIPEGYTITWGAFTGAAGAVSVYGV